MKFGSLFSGIGGFDLGFERAGLECAWQAEVDKDCQRVLRRHWPNVELFNDVRTIGKLSDVDVLCGGFPCQDLSVAGKRKGLAGERSGLWFEFLRIAERNKPRWLVIENVPGLLSSDEGRDFAALLRGLVNVGYRIAWRVTDAQYFGVAQRRRRVFIVGSLGDGSCAEILFESEGLSGDSPPRRETRAGVANAVTTGSGKSCGPRNGNGTPLHLIDVAATLDQRGRGPTDAVMMNLQVARPLANSRTTNHYDESQQTYVTHALRSEGADASEDGTGRGTPMVVANCFNGYTGGPDDNDAQGNHLIAFTLHGSDKTVNTASETDIAGSVRTKAPGSIENSSTTIVAFSSKDHGADAGSISPTLRSMDSPLKENRNGGGQVAIAFSNRGNETEQAETIRADCHGALPMVAFHENKSGQLSEADVLGLRSGASYSYQGVGGNFGVRRLTPRECERLQGFPDDWTRHDSEGKEISDSARYRMLGNAVAVPNAKWLGKRIEQHSTRR